MDDFRATIPVTDASAERDTTEHCVTLEAWFLTTLLGLSGVLTLDLAWDGTPEEKSAAVDAVEFQMEKLMGGDCCNAVQTIGRSKSGYLVSIDQEGNETLLQSFYDNEDIAAMPEVQDVDNQNANICAGVKFLVDRQLADVMFTLDQAQLAIDGYLTIADTIAGILKVAVLGTSTPFDLIDAFGEWTADVATLTVSTLKVAFGDPEVRYKLEENLYCAISGAEDKQLTLTMYEQATNELPILESQSSILARFWKGFEITAPSSTFEKILRFYNLGALNEDNTCAAEFTCPFPEGCSHLGVDEGGVVWTMPNGTGTGNERCAGAGNRLKIIGTLPVDREITSFAFKVQKTGGITTSIIDAWLEKDGAIVRDLLTYNHADGAYTWYQWPGINTADTLADTIVLDITSANTCVKDVIVCFAGE
jgi:hypothetical protein